MTDGARSVLRLAASLALCQAPHGLPAQADTPGRRVARVVLVDAATGRPLPRTALRAVGSEWSAQATSADGVLTWDTAGVPRARAECAVRGQRVRWHRLQDLEARQLPAHSTDTVIRVRVNAGPCDRRPFVEAYGLWTGRYHRGFETSYFRICGDSARKSIWLAWSAGAWKGPPRDPADRKTFLLRVRGRLAGPWVYGHIGLAEYQLTVDSVRFARPLAEGAADCTGAAP